MHRLSLKRIGLAGSIVAGVVTLMLTSAPAAAQGKTAPDLYLDKCSVCHGADGAGKTAKGKKLKVKDVRETIGKLMPEQMVEIVTKGKAPNMDGYAKDFSSDQI